MVRRRDSSSELTPEDFLESRQDDSDSPNPVLDLIRNVDAARGDDDGVDGDGMPGVRPTTITESSSEAAWDGTATAEKDADSPETSTTEGSASPDAANDDDEEPEWEPEEDNTCSGRAMPSTRAPRPQTSARECHAPPTRAA